MLKTHHPENNSFHWEQDSPITVDCVRTTLLFVGDPVRLVNFRRRGPGSSLRLH